MRAEPLKLDTLEPVEVPVLVDGTEIGVLRSTATAGLLYSGALMKGAPRDLPPGEGFVPSAEAYKEARLVLVGQMFFEAEPSSNGDGTKFKPQPAGTEWARALPEPIFDALDARCEELRSRPSKNS